MLTPGREQGASALVEAVVAVAGALRCFRVDLQPDAAAQVTVMHTEARYAGLTYTTVCSVSSFAVRVLVRGPHLVQIPDDVVGRGVQRVQVQACTQVPSTDISNMQ